MKVATLYPRRNGSPVTGPDGKKYKFEQDETTGKFVCDIEDEAVAKQFLKSYPTFYHGDMDPPLVNDPRQRDPGPPLNERTRAEDAPPPPPADDRASPDNPYSKFERDELARMYEERSGKKAGTLSGVALAKQLVKLDLADAKKAEEAREGKQ